MTDPIVAAAERNRIIMDTATLRQQDNAALRRCFMCIALTGALVVAVVALAWWTA